MKRFYVAAAALVGALGFTSIADAQIRIGPFGGVNVRVPFVSVDVLPFGGGTRVRAPFTSVGTGLYGGGYYGRPYDYGYSSRYRGYAQPYYYDPAPVIPTPFAVPVYPPYLGPGYLDEAFVYPEPYAEAPIIAHPGYVAPDYVAPDYVAPEYRAGRPVITSPPLLEDDLRAAADRLARALSLRRDDADVWMNYLKPDQIIDTIDRGGSPAELKSLLLNYEGLSGNSQLSHIWVTDGFRQTHQLLRQWVESSAEPQGQTESDGASVLERSDSSTPAAGKSKPNSEVEPTLAKPRKAANQDVEDLPAPRPTTSL